MLVFLAGLLPLLMETTFKSFVLLALFAVITTTLRRRSAALRHFLWTLAIAGVLILPALIAAMPKAKLLPRWPDSEIAFTNQLPADALIETPGGDQAAIAAEEATSIRAGTLAQVPMDHDQPGVDRRDGKVVDGASPRRPTAIAVIVLVVWMSGVGVNGLGVALGFFRLIRLSQSASEITDESAVGLLRRLRQRVGMRQSVRLLKSDCCSIPATWSLPQLCVLVPGDFESWIRERQQVVLIHELAHVRRCDQAILLLTHVACSLYWFNPLLWFAARQMARDREHACDELVLQLGEQPSIYAEHLLRIATRTTGAGGVVWSMAPSMIGRAEISSRVEAILDPKRRRKALSRWTIVCGSIAGCLLIVWLAMLQSASALADAPEEAAVEENALPEGALFRLGTDRFRQEGEVMKVCYSRDGKMIASISRDAIIIWDARTGKQLKRLHAKTDTQYFTAISFSPDSEEVAAAHRSRVCIWDVDSGLELLSFSPMQDRFLGDVEIRYSPDGTQLALSGGVGVSLFDTANGNLTKTLTIKNDRRAFHGVCWSVDGKFLSSAAQNPAVATWNVESGELVRRFEAKREKPFVYSLAMSADDKMLIAGSGNLIDCWQFETGEHIKQIKTDAEYINMLVLAPDNRTLIVGCQDGFIRIVNVETGQQTSKIHGRLHVGRSLAVSPDFTTIALGAVFPTIRQWDLKTGDEKFPEFTSFGHDAEVRCVAYSPDGRLIASGGVNWQINLWDAGTGKHRLRFPVVSSAKRIAFTPSGQQLLTSWENTGLVRTWDVSTGQEGRSIDTGADRVRAFIMTSDGKQLIAVVSDSEFGSHGEEKLQVWDWETGQKVREFRFKTTSTQSVALTPSRKSLVTGSATGIIHVLDVESGKELETLPGHHHIIDSLVFTSDGALLASGSYDRTICLWDTKTWKKQRVLKGHERVVTSVAFSPDGRVLASGEGQGRDPWSIKDPHRIRFWDVASGEPLGTLTGYNTNTSAVAFAPNGKQLVTAHENTTLLIWDVSRFIGR